MRVLNYLELEGVLERSGIGTAAAQQREALSRVASGDADVDHTGDGRVDADGGHTGDGRVDADVDVVTEPWGGPPWSLPARVVRGEAPIVDYDIAHCNTIGPGSVAVARHAGRTGRPLILHCHTTGEDFAESFRGSSYATGPLRRYLRWFYSQADLVLCPSETTRGVLESYPVDAPVESITNGIDLRSLEGYERFREPYRDEYDLEGMVVFAVGNVFERKGLTTFCRLAERTDHEFVWFGHYDRGPQASSTVRNWTRNPPDNLTFTGWVDDKRGAFAAGDVFCFPTKVENQGLVVLEAMACGKAVVLRDIPVFDEFYTHDEDCLKCETLAEFREALDRLAANPDLRRRLGENGRETAAEHDLEVVGERLLGHYRRLLGDGQRGESVAGSG